MLADMHGNATYAVLANVSWIRCARTNCTYSHVDGATRGSAVPFLLRNAHECAICELAGGELMNHRVQALSEQAVLVEAHTELYQSVVD